MTNTPAKKDARPSTAVRMPTDLLGIIEDVRRELQAKDALGRAVTTADAVRYVFREYAKSRAKGGGQ